MSRSRAGRVRTEIRWILPADLGPALEPLVPDKEPERRVDTYLMAATDEGRSLKRRGTAGAVECKFMVREPRQAELAGGAVGWLQRWRKEPYTDPLPDGPELVVRKVRWRHQALEVVEVEVGAVRAWSVALTADRDKLGPLVRRSERLFDGWDAAGALTLERSTSYGEWLTSL